MRQALARQEWDIVIADYQLPQFGAAEALRIRNETARDIPFIIVSGTIGEDRAVEMMRAGAQDYVLKDGLARLGPAVRRETEEAQARRDRRREYRRVEEQLRDKEQHFVERTLDTQRTLRENVVLLQEVHHRVRNNLQLISSLLTMQISCMGDDDRFTAPLHKAHHRVLALSLVHQQLFQSDTLSDLDFAEYVESLSRQLYSAYCVDTTRIQLEMSVEPLHLKVDESMNCGLILNELLANSLRHAFPQDRDGVIQIRLRRIGTERAELSVVDNGIGLPPHFRYQDVHSLGLKIVSVLVSQLHGNLQVSGNGGTGFTFDWKLSASNS